MGNEILLTEGLFGAQYVDSVVYRMHHIDRKKCYITRMCGLREFIKESAERVGKSRLFYHGIYISPSCDFLSFNNISDETTVIMILSVM